MSEKKLEANGYTSDIVSAADVVSGVIEKFNRYYETHELSTGKEISEKQIPGGLEPQVEKALKQHGAITWQDESSGRITRGGIPMPKKVVFGDGQEVSFDEWIKKNGVACSLTFVGKVAAIFMVAEKGNLGPKTFFHAFEPGQEWSLMVDPNNPSGFYLTETPRIKMLNTGINNV